MKLRIVGLALAGVIVTAAWFGFVFKPGQNRLSAVRADVTTTQAEVASLQAKLAELQQLKANEPQLRADVEKMQTAIPEQPKVSDFIRQVQDAATAAGIDFISISPQIPGAPKTATTAAAPVAAAAATPAPSAAPSADGAAPAAPVAPPVAGYQSISINVSADGNFFTLESFIDKIEHLARASRLDSFKLSSSEEEGAAGLSLDMVLQIFQVTPPTLTSGAAVAPTTGGV